MDSTEVENEETLILNDVNDFEEIYDENTVITRDKTGPQINENIGVLSQNKIINIYNDNIWEHNKLREPCINNSLSNEITVVKKEDDVHRTNCKINIDVDNNYNRNLRQAVIKNEENNNDDSQNNISAITKVSHIKKDLFGSQNVKSNFNVVANIKTEKESYNKTDLSKHNFEHNLQESFNETKLKIYDEFQSGKEAVELNLNDICSNGSSDCDNLDENTEIKTEEVHIKSEETFDGTENREGYRSKQKYGSRDQPVKTYKCKEPHCTYSGPCKSRFQRHMLIHMKPEDCQLFTCQYCDYKSKYKMNIKVHEVVHSEGERPFECKQCDMKFKTAQTRKFHIKQVHDAFEFFCCFHCDFKTKNKQTLGYHIKNLHREHENVYECPECDFKTNYKLYLKQHSVGHENVAKTISYNCTECPFVAVVKENLQKHIKRNHRRDSMKLHKCDLCSFETIYGKNLRLHKTHVHENSKGMNMFKCPECDQEFKYKSGMTAHVVRKHSDVTAEYLQCANCYYKTRSKSSLARHMRLNHLRKVMNCPHCKFVTTKNAVLRKHVDSHEKDEECHVCVICYHRCKTKQLLKYHLAHSHDQAEPNVDISFKCDTCGFKSSNKWEFRQHVLYSEAHKNAVDTCKK